MKSNRGELPGMLCCAGIYIWRPRRGRSRGIAGAHAPSPGRGCGEHRPAPTRRDVG